MFKNPFISIRLPFPICLSCFLFFFAESSGKVKKKTGTALLRLGCRGRAVLAATATGRKDSWPRRFLFNLSCSVQHVVAGFSSVSAPLSVNSLGGDPL